MEGDEREEYGEELQDVIEGLRSLARGVETPPALLAKVLTRGQCLLPPQRGSMGWWRKVVMASLRGVVDPPRWGLALASACLVLLCVGPTIVTLRGAVARLQAKLEAVEERERGALEHERQLTNIVIKQADRLGRANFELGRYEESEESYWQIAERNPQLQYDYLIKAATAAWYACDYQKARDILEERIKDKQSSESSKDLLRHFVLGSVYHSLGDLDTAMNQYKMVAESGENEYREAAWFNVGVVYALKYKKSKDEKEVGQSIAALEESIKEASLRSRAQSAERIRKIQEARQPFDQRPLNKCGDHYHVTQDLTPLIGVSAFTEWLNQKQVLSQRSL